jgi:plasmid stabilization system protein ParE
MAQKVIYKKRFINKLEKLLVYLEKEWGQKSASGFIDKLSEKLKLIKKQPDIGSLTPYKNTRSLLITKQNKVYYRVRQNAIEILSMIDTRRHPGKNPFNKTK